MALDPDDIEALLLQGRLLAQEGRSEETRDSFARALELFPQMPQVLIALAAAEIDLGSLGKAQKLLNEVSRFQSDHPMVHHLHAIIALKSGDFRTARTKAEVILAKNPRHAPSLLVAGTASAKLQQFERARDYLHKYLAENPNDVGALLQRAWVSNQLGDFQSAFATLSGPEFTDRSAPFYLRTAADAAIGIEDYDAAVRLLERYAESVPDDKDVWFKLGPRVGP